jgi:hypothetical protein
MTLQNPTVADGRRRDFLLQSIQPALLGLMDGSVSTLAPIFAAAGLTSRPLSTFFRACSVAGGWHQHGPFRGLVRRWERDRSR